MEVAVYFIHELVDSQILISELEPAVTHMDALNVLIEKLNALPNTDGQINTGLWKKIRK